MTRSRLILRSLFYHRRMHAGVLAGTLMAAAILTGALLVGDSVDDSLRRQALMRVGDVHFAIDSRTRYFSQRLCGGLRELTRVQAASALSLRGMALAPEAGNDGTQVNRVNVIGVGEDFGAFGAGADFSLKAQETILNERLAAALGVRAGDEVSLRVAAPSLLSRDAPLSSREEAASTRVRCKIKAVLPDANLGEFSLRAGQTRPYNAFVNLEWLQGHVDMPGRANLLLVGEGMTQEELDEALTQCWQLEDVGLRFRVHPSGLVQLETDRIFLDASVADAATDFPDAQGTLTYLVNTIANGDRMTPYSFAVAGPAPRGMGDDEIVINRWVAQELAAAPGDELTVAYYDVGPANQFVETRKTFTVFAVVEMNDLATEKDLAPTFPGLSDVERCEEWHVGIPMEDELLNDPANEAYWDAYGPTPKIILTLDAGQRLWANRFGDLMTVRYPGAEARASQVRDVLKARVTPADAGLFFRPVRAEALAAVSQAMDLGGLFLGMSFFLIVAALILTTLLFVFHVQHRAGELGALLALGFGARNVRRLMFAETAVVAALGAAGGVWVGVLYTQALIFGLTWCWQGAVAYTAISYHAEPGTFLKGAGITLACSLIALAASLWRHTRRPARELLAMDFTQDILTLGGRRHAARRWLPVMGVVCAVGLVVHTQVTAVEAVVMPFFAAGSLLLLSGLGFCRSYLGRLRSENAGKPPTLVGVAVRNASRRPGRSLSVIALLATGCFLVLSVSAMQEDLTSHAGERWSGTGGFELFAETTVPLDEALTDRLADPTVEAVSVRVHEGDDASCLNLNRAQTPTLLGVNTASLSATKAFLPERGAADLWSLVNVNLPDGAIPALVGDTDTALWGLKKKVGLDDGDVIEYRDEAGGTFRVKLVGCLPMRLSVFQGALLISEEAFTRLYPSEHGFRMFLLDTPPDSAQRIASELNGDLERFGIDVRPAVDRLREFYTVESTYLAMFLVLGGLGLALGSAAMGVVVVRNLFERRREVAMLRALGFCRAAILRLFLVEYGMLVLMGIAVGSASAAVSMVPAVTSSGSRVSLGLQCGLVCGVLAIGLLSVAGALRIGLEQSDVSALQEE